MGVSMLVAAVGTARESAKVDKGCEPILIGGAILILAFF
jgi:hypothetical protein